MQPDLPITLRLSIVRPPAGVRWGVQLGRHELLPPVHVADDHVMFEVPLILGSNARGTVQLRGAAVQGPPSARFVYVNSGKRAAGPWSGWDRRAKVSLATIDIAALQNLTGPAILDGAILGTARDGGPACASVKLIDGAWKVGVADSQKSGQ